MDELNLSEEELNEVLLSLKSKGVIDEIEIDGVPHFKINDLGIAFIKHSDSDPNTRN